MSSPPARGRAAAPTARERYFARVSAKSRSPSRGSGGGAASPSPRRAGTAASGGGRSSSRGDATARSTPRTLLSGRATARSPRPPSRGAGRMPKVAARRASIGGGLSPLARSRLQHRRQSDADRVQDAVEEAFLDHFSANAASAWRDPEQLARMAVAAVHIQRVFRGHLGRLVVALHYRRRAVEFRWRMRRVAAGPLRLRQLRHGAALRIQRLIRAFLFRRRCAYGIRRLVNRCATHIQRVWRGYQGRRLAKFVRLQLTVLARKVQRAWRAKLARRRMQEARERRIMRWAAMRLQALWRGRRERKILWFWRGRRYAAVLKIQRAWRVAAYYRHREDRAREQLMDWMVALRDFGYTCDVPPSHEENVEAHRRALEDRRVRGREEYERRKRLGGRKDESVTLPSGDFKKVQTNEELAKAMDQALAKMPMGTVVGRRAARARVTTTKVWAMTDAGPKTTSKAAARDGVLDDRIQKALKHKRGEYEEPAFVFFTIPSVLVPLVPTSLFGAGGGGAEKEGGGGSAEADTGAGGGAGGGGGGAGGGGGGGAASGASGAAGASGGGKGEEAGRSFFGSSSSALDPSIKQVLAEMVLLSNALQEAQVRLVERRRRIAAYALMSIESKARQEALRLRMTAAKGNALIQQVRRKRQEVVSLAEITFEMRGEVGQIREEVALLDVDLDSRLHAMREFERLTKKALHRSGGVLDESELETLLALLPDD